ncbi:hypothetical protein M0R45_032985 [Rubus argutus]|uniref:F-box domain-containing protein n=1 Tax=Rubus argutus TaxID=59490 RepID=A0AAW1WLD5_RUBAR
MEETSNHPRRLGLGNPNRNLNDLPKEILVHILSFLLTVDAIRSSLISSKWRPLWSLVPSLNFYFFNYDAGFFFRNRTNEEYRAPFFNPFVDLVDRVLNTRPLGSPSLQTFSLSFPYFNEYVSRVDSWIRCAVTRLRARELDLHFCFDTQFHNFNDRYDFPFSVLRDGCVQVFSLAGSSLTLPVDMRSLGSLRSVYLKKIDLTDEMVRDLTLGCPNLEDLELHTCEWLESLSICSTRLKKLVLEYEYFTHAMHTLEIDCPNLCSIRLRNCGFAHYVLNNATSLVEDDSLVIVNEVSSFNLSFS